MAKLRNISSSYPRPAAIEVGPRRHLVLDGGDWRRLIDAIPTDTVRDLRGRALIATLTYSFARITAGLRMRVEDRRPHGAGWELRLREKGGKQHVIQCHHALAELLHAYICHCRLLVRSARVRCS